MKIFIIAAVFSLMSLLIGLGTGVFVTKMVNLYENSKRKEISNFCHSQKDKAYQDCYDELYLNWRG